MDRTALTLLLAAVVALGAPGAAGAATHLGDRSLRAGDRGPDVRALQDSLTRLGFAVTPDGVFGPATGRAVGNWERRMAVRVDRVVSRAEGRRLRRPLDTGAGPLGARSLRAGTHGPDVADLQRTLSRLGFAVTVDGRFGPATAAAVRAWERAHARGADGVVSRAEGRLLRRLGGRAVAVDARPPSPGLGGGAGVGARRR